MRTARHSRRRGPAFFAVAALASIPLRAAPAAPAALPAIDAASVAAWAGETFPPALARQEFSGLTVSVVRDGALIFSKGYGRADYSREGAVDPAATRFRIGSITKTFTASLLAQLLDEGRIASLDDPVNRYLKDYALPANGGVDITLHHLLTHTAGFEDRAYAIGALRPVPARLPAAGFDKLRPAYVRPAGVRAEYSNFGIALLGRVVEDITGQPIAQVMRERLFEPLGMSHTQLPSDVREPEGLGRPAVILPDGSKQPLPYTAINPSIAAAGSIVTTADDMARYMMAQLRARPAGGPDGRPVLSERALAALHTRRAGNAPESTGLGMVFFVEDWAGVETIAHGGNWEGFHSWMTLLPSQDTGVFVSVMSEAPPPGASFALRTLLAPWIEPAASPAVVSGLPYVKTFLTRFLGEHRPLPPAATGTVGASLAGWYRPDRRVFTTAESVVDLIFLGGGIARIAPRDGGLDIAGSGPWRPASAPGVFVLDAPARNQAVIRDDPRVGAPVMVPDLGIYTSTRIAWYQHPLLHAYLCLCALLLCVIGGALALRRARGTARVAGLVTVVLALALPVMAYQGIDRGTGMLLELFGGNQGPLALFVACANLLLLLAVATLVFAWRSPPAAGRGRWPLATIGVAGLVLASVLACYHVIGWQLPG
jgi:CubicO group peptidase (beta-lactamase class C family)